jgi:predicted PurR-regulated permease PerM
MKKGERILVYSAVVFGALFFLFMGLNAAEPFLVPLLTAMVMAFLVLPITNRLEKWGFKKIWATTVSTLVLLVLAVGFMYIVFLQIKSFTNDWEEIRTQMGKRFEEITEYLIENTPLEESHVRSFSPGGAQRGQHNMPDYELQEYYFHQYQYYQSQHRMQLTDPPPPEEPVSWQQETQQQSQPPEDQQQQNQEEDEEEQDQEEQEEEQENDEEEEPTFNVGEQVLNVMAFVLGFITDFILVFVYVFFLIHFRTRFKEFILRFFPRDKRPEVASIISRTSSVSRGYLAGRLLLMVSLTAFYYAGLAISGLDNAFLIALLAAALSIIPFVGNIIGYIIAMVVGLLTDGGGGTLLGVTVTFVVAQFIDSYILQPIVLGDKVNVHPFFIVITVILGFHVWGVMGMVLAIPLFGMITVVCRHVPALNPFGYLFSNKDIAEPPEEKEEE